MLNFIVVHRFITDKLITPLGSFNSNQFTLDPFLTFTFITTFAFDEFILQLITAFSLDPFLTFGLDHPFLITLVDPHHPFLLEPDCQIIDLVKHQQFHHPPLVAMVIIKLLNQQVVSCFE